MSMDRIKMFSEQKEKERWEFDIKPVTRINHPRADLVISYAKKHAAFAGTLRAIAGPKPLYKPLNPSVARIFLNASNEPENFGFLWSSTW